MRFVHAFKDGSSIQAPMELNDMDFYRAAQEAGFTVLGSHAFPSLTGAANPFVSPPSGTRMIVFCVRGYPITLCCDGTTATAGGNGIDYAVGGPYALPLDDSESANCSAVQNGGAATGWAEFWGLP